MKCIKRPAKGKESGFTLLEVIMAIALSGIIAGGILVSLGTLAKTFVNVDTHETAKDIAISDMENIRSQSYADNYTILSSSMNPSASGQPVTFIATVTPGTATGTITFFDEDTILDTGTINNGQATYTTSALATGSHPIKAVYSGNGTTSLILTQMVNDSSTTSTSTEQTIQNYLADITVTWLNMNEQKLDILIYLDNLDGNPLFTLTGYRVNY